jgi:hypothetical protein
MYIPRNPKNETKIPLVIEVPHNVYEAIMGQDPDALRQQLLSGRFAIDTILEDPSISSSP